MNEKLGELIKHVVTRSNADLSGHNHFLLSTTDENGNMHHFLPYKYLSKNIVKDLNKVVNDSRRFNEYGVAIEFFGYAVRECTNKVFRLFRRLDL